MDTDNNKPTIVGVRFSQIGKNYYFDASKLVEPKLGEYLVVETSRGWQLGQLTQFVNSDELNKDMQYKPVDRIATEADLKKKGYLDSKAEESLEFAKKKLSIKNVKGVKLISAEFSFDEKSLSFLYSTENDNHINYGSIIKEIKNEYNLRKVDFHKIGPRDVAKYYCGMGACGLEMRCCSQFIKKFESISIRMAKAQGISLTPSDITGMCNRLRCCLGYEYCTYVDALKDMPKKKKKVKTPYGIGTVKDLAPMKKTVFVYVPEHGVKEFGLDEIEEVLQDTSQTKPAAKKANVQNKTGKRKRFNNRKRRPRSNRPKSNG